MILVILVVFHTAGFNEKKKRDIYHEKKKKKIFFLDAVGWKPYCSRLGRWVLGRLAGRWGAGRGRWGAGLGAG